MKYEITKEQIEALKRLLEDLNISHKTFRQVDEQLFSRLPVILEKKD